MRGWVGQLWSVLSSRQGLGALMMAVFGAVALGVVPNLVQAVSDSVWVFGVVFVVCVALTLAGWAVMRPRGVGVVVALYPPAQNTRAWAEVLTKASRAAHGSTLVIDRERMRLDRLAGADRRARADLVFGLIDARVSEFLASGGVMEQVGLYPSAQLADGFELGRRLWDAWPQPHLTVMHNPRGGPVSAVVPGLVLSSALLAPLSAAQQTLLAPHLDVAAVVGADGGVPGLVEVPGAAQEVRHRLGLVVRLAAGSSMVDDAVFVARNGEVVRDGDGRHTGYVLDDAHPSAPGRGCGAYVVVEIGGGYLPDRAEVFAAATVCVRQCWQAAARQWSQQIGRPARGVLFFHGPLAIAIGLGWLLGREVDFVPHEVSLAGSGAGVVV